MRNSLQTLERIKKFEQENRNIQQISRFEIGVRSDVFEKNKILIQELKDRNLNMNYLGIDKSSISNGPGVRVVLWVAGCKIHCKGCQNHWQCNKKE